MKKMLTVLLTGAIAFTAAACSPAGTQTETQAGTTAPAAALSSEQLASIEETVGELEGVVYITKNGEPVYRYAKGVTPDGQEISIDSVVPVGSVSKQFCAAAILMLRDAGKLSLDDTLGTYCPDYEAAKDVTLKQMLSMRSGIPEIVNNGVPEGVSEKNTAEENRTAIFKAMYETALNFEPDTGYEYTNSNFMLLSYIVEQVSGKAYIDYLREALLAPMGMEHTGTIDELAEDPDWANGTSYFYPAGVPTGAGDIVSTAVDMDKWMTGLRSGKVLSAESYREMTTDQSPDHGTQYGYGMMVGKRGSGVGHEGAIMLEGKTCTCFDYINEAESCNIFAYSNELASHAIEGLEFDLIDAVTGTGTAATTTK